MYGGDLLAQEGGDDVGGRASEEPQQAAVDTVELANRVNGEEANVMRTSTTAWGRHARPVVQLQYPRPGPSEFSENLRNRRSEDE